MQWINDTGNALPVKLSGDLVGYSAQEYRHEYPCPVCDGAEYQRLLAAGEPRTVEREKNRQGLYAKIKHLDVLNPVLEKMVFDAA